jgi:probable F420-dependent oxidoreductase
MPDYFKIVFDPLETLSFIAARTERILLGSSVIVPFFHSPVVLAKRFATLDQFSRGRLIAGLGQGWLNDEFEAANVSWKRRGNGFEDYVGALRATWGPDPVSYEGRFYRIVESDIGPKPYQVGGPPILFGVGSRRALERAACLADGINPLALSWNQLEQITTLFPELVRQAGRDPQRMLIVLRANARISTSPQSEPRTPLSGSLSQIRGDMQRLEQLGVEHLFFDLCPMPVEQQLQLLADLRRTAN